MSSGHNALNPYPFERSAGTVDPPASPLASEMGSIYNPRDHDMIELVPIVTTSMAALTSNFDYPQPGQHVGGSSLNASALPAPGPSIRSRSRSLLSGISHVDDTALFTIEAANHVADRSDYQTGPNYSQLAAEDIVVTDANLSNSWLDFRLVDSNGGFYGDAFAIENILRDDETVYCSRLKRHVNIVLAHTSKQSPIRAPPFYLDEVSIRIPKAGFTSPLKNGFIFVCSTPTDLSMFDAYDTIDTNPLLTQEEDLPNNLTVALPMVPSCVRTVLFFQLDTNTAFFTYKFQTPIRDARFIFLKFLSSFGTQENVDVEFVGFKGREGKLSFPNGNLR